MSLAEASASVVGLGLSAALANLSWESSGYSPTPGGGGWNGTTGGEHNASSEWPPVLDTDGGDANILVSLWNNSDIGTVAVCLEWRPPQHLLFHLANVCFLSGYVAPDNRHGQLFRHIVLILGFFLFSTWAWSIVCAADIFSWNFAFMLLNIGQMFYTMYQMRPVKFEPELEPIYQTLFQPFSVSRLLFKRLVSSEYAQIFSLHAGEAYAMQKLTRTDRLGLLVSGKVHVLSDHSFLHHINEREFLDSPEFEAGRSANRMDDKFKVSIVAATPCRYLFWQRSALEYLFVKEQHLATVMTTVIARDIANKLYAMNKKIVTEKGSHLDIRLPTLTSTLTIDDARSPVKAVRTGRRASPSLDSAQGDSRDMSLPNGLAPLPELPSCDDLASSNDLETWLESSSKFQSCEMSNI